MKAYKGTLIALVMLMFVGGVVWFVKPAALQQDPVGNPRLFRFEKHELVRVEVRQAVGTDVVLAEQEGVWRIEGTGHQAGRSMVNRVKHQLHDLTARATVVDDPENLSLYGLGKNAIRVALTMRNGEQIEFDVGDPNPTSVSYYIQLAGSGQIYTVKKAAVDYYSLTLDEFRERRFASFDSKDVTALTAELRLPDANHTLDLERVSERKWRLRSPIEMDADHDHARRLMGRVSAMKAVRFVPRDKDLAQYGLEDPRADIHVRFASREPLRIRVGASVEAERGYDQLAYVLMDEEDTVFVARSGMLEDFSSDPVSFRNRRVVKMLADDVVAIDVVLTKTADDDMSGEGHVRYAAEQWVWQDGVPVSGSTPKRVARRIAEMEVDTFVDDADASLVTYGLVSPRAQIELRDREENVRVVQIGAKGPPVVDPDGNEYPRYYANVVAEKAVYLVSMGVLEVVRDLVRESGRKDKRDQEKAARQERIETASDDESP